MFVAMEAETPCPRCGLAIKVIMTGTARVNKRSIRVNGPLLGAIMHRNCPDCGAEVGRDGAPRTPYRLGAESEAAVIAYRQRKWGVSDGTGPLTEGRKKHQRGEDVGAA